MKLNLNQVNAYYQYNLNQQNRQNILKLLSFVFITQDKNFQENENQFSSFSNIQSQSFNSIQQQKFNSISSNNLDQRNKVFKQACVTDRGIQQQSSILNSQQMLNSTRFDTNSSSPVFIDCFNCQSTLKYEDLQSHSDRCSRTNPCIEGLDSNSAIQQINNKLERINTFFSSLLKEQKRLNINQRIVQSTKEIIQRAQHFNQTNIESLINEINQELNNFNRNKQDYIYLSLQQIKSIISLKISTLKSTNQQFSPIRQTQQNNFFLNNSYNTKQKQVPNKHQQQSQHIYMRSEATPQNIQQNASDADIYFLKKEITQSNGYLSPQAGLPHAKQNSNVLQLIKSTSCNSTNPFSNYLQNYSNQTKNQINDNQSNCDTNNSTKSSLEIKNQIQGGNLSSASNNTYSIQQKQGQINNSQQQTNAFQFQQNNKQLNKNDYLQNYNKSNSTNLQQDNNFKFFDSNKKNNQQINNFKPQNKQQFKEDVLLQNKMEQTQGSSSVQSFVNAHQYSNSQTQENQQTYLNQQTFSQKNILNSNIISNSTTFKSQRNPGNELRYQGSFLVEGEDVKRSNNNYNSLQVIPNQSELIDGTQSQDSKRELLNKLVQKQKDLQNLQQLSQKLKKDYQNNQEEINKVYTATNLNSSKSPISNQNLRYSNENSILDQHIDNNLPQLKHQSSSQSNSTEITQSNFLSSIQLGSLNDLMNEDEKQLQSIFFNLCYNEKNNYPKSHILQKIPVSLLFKEALDMNIRDEEQMKYFIQYAFENATTYIDVDKVKRSKKNQIFKNNLAQKVKLIHQ